MLKHIPDKTIRRWSGPYLGNYYGTLWKTRNIDLDRSEGVIGLAQRMERIEDSTELTNLNSLTVKAFTRTDADCTDRYWALDCDALFRTDSSGFPFPEDDWDTDALDSTPTAGLSDFVVHGKDSRNDSGRDKLFVTTDTDIWVLNDTGNSKWTGNWWVTKQAQPALKSNVSHPIEYFSFRKISLVGDGNLVHTISRPSDTQNDTVTYGRLVLPPRYSIRSIFTTSDRAWLCCIDKQYTQGAIVEWDGFSQTYNKIHKSYAVGAMTGVDFAGLPIVLNTKGLFLENNGAGFVPMIRNGQTVAYPIFEEPGNVMSDCNTGFPLLLRVEHRGMVVSEDGLVYMNTGAPMQQSFRQGAGIWCLNPLTGRLYNKFSLGHWGDSTDYGQEAYNANNVYDNGGLYYVPQSVGDRNLLAGAIVGATSGGSQSGIWLLSSPNSTTPSRGYFVTQYMTADEVLETWDSLWVVFKRFFSSGGNSIVVKAKGVRSLTQFGGDPIDKTITWTSTTTFTVTLGATDDQLQVGDEVEVFFNENAGILAHITVIAGAHAALQTITIDETVKSGAGTSRARFDRWKKIGTITNADRYHQKINIGIDSTFLQFKVELRGVPREMEIQELVTQSKQALNLE